MCEDTVKAERMVQSYDKFDEEVRIQLCDDVMLVIFLQLGKLVKDLQEAKECFVENEVEWKDWKLAVYYSTSNVV